MTLKWMLVSLCPGMTSETGSLTYCKWTWQELLSCPHLLSLYLGEHVSKSTSWYLVRQKKCNQTSIFGNQKKEQHDDVRRCHNVSINTSISVNIVNNLKFVEEIQSTLQPLVGYNVRQLSFTGIFGKVC